MWDQKVRHLAQEGYRRRPQAPLRGTKPRPSRRVEEVEPLTERPPYAGIGTELKSRRETQGRGLGEVSDALHIQPRYLEAIEEGRFDDLPGSAYATGFMRAYGQYLGADPREVVSRFRQESTLPHGPTKLVAPEAIAEPRRPRMTVVLLSLLAAAVLYAGWNMLSSGHDAPRSGVEPAPERLAAVLHDDKTTTTPRVEPVPRRLVEAANEVKTPAVGASTRRSEVSVAAREAQRDANATQVGVPPQVAPLPPRTASAKPTDATSKEPAEDTPPAAPTLDTVEVPKPAAAPTPPPPVASGSETASLPPPSADGSAYVPQRFGGADDARVVVKAKVDSWVQIQAGRHETLLTRILRPGDTFYAPNRADLMLTTGNVGGLEIVVDGEPLGPLGPLGSVRRNIPLDAEKLLAMNAQQR